MKSGRPTERTFPELINHIFMSYLVAHHIYGRELPRENIKRLLVHARSETVKLAVLNRIYQLADPREFYQIARHLKFNDQVISKFAYARSDTNNKKLAIAAVLRRINERATKIAQKQRYDLAEYVFLLYIKALFVKGTVRMTASKKQETEDNFLKYANLGIMKIKLLTKIANLSDQNEFDKIALHIFNNNIFKKFIDTTCDGNFFEEVETHAQVPRLINQIKQRYLVTQLFVECKDLNNAIPKESQNRKLVLDYLSQLVDKLPNSKAKNLFLNAHGQLQSQNLPLVKFFMVNGDSFKSKQRSFFSRLFHTNTDFENLQNILAKGMKKISEEKHNAKKEIIEIPLQEIPRKKI